MTGDRLLTTEEVATILAVTPRWVADATRDGRLPCVKLGRFRRYDLDDVLAWIDEQKTSAALVRRRSVRAGSTK